MNNNSNTVQTIVITVICCVVATLQAQTWQSSLVKFGNDGKLIYTVDSAKNRIPDFSYAGYKNGDSSLPIVNAVHSISPVAGDNTAHIQKAIDSVGKLPLNAQGIRGALVLKAGRYHVYGTVRVKYSGVVLRGEGNGSDSLTNTIIYGRGDTPHQREIVIAGGGSSTKWNSKVSGTETNITSDTVAVGERTFTVANASTYAVGDNIIITHPCTAKWLTAVDSGGSHWYEPGAELGVDVPWTVNQVPILYNRWITAIQGNTITIDVPVFNHLIRSLSQSTIYKYARTGLLTNIGVENLRIDIESLGGEDENHAWQALYLLQVEDAWVKNCTFTGFGQSGVITNTATRVTVQDCNSLDPVSIITGERRYNFNTYTASQQILFKNCFARNGRHHYVSNGTSYTSGNVFVDCTSQGAYTSSEGHRQWTTGVLYDNHVEVDGPRSDKRLLGLYNRGHYGTSHGWTTAHCVAWNCNVRPQGYLIVQQPPTAQNYAIGCFGIVSGNTPPAPFKERAGFIEGTNVPGLNPRSLYYAQYNDRKNITNVTAAGTPVHGFFLQQNFPNPFNPSTTIIYSIPSAANVTLDVFDMTGKLIRTVVNEQQESGQHTVSFSDGKLPSGTYFFRLQAGPNYSTKKMILIK
jgi:hypothetical protein